MLPGFADSHVKGPTFRGLLRQGMDVVRAQDRGLCGRDDPILLQAATAEGRLMLTGDKDFLVHHAAWQGAGRSHAGIVYWHQDKYPIGEAIRRVLHYARNTAPADAANVVKYL
jgi:Domain of unknown function (DUF5615)